MKKSIVGILLVLVLAPLAFAAGDGAGGLGVFGSWWDSVGYFALAGLNLVLGNVVLFGEAKYNVFQNDDEWRWQGSDVEQKNSLDGFAANVGLKLAF